jgi:hypothetical protein
MLTVGKGCVNLDWMAIASLAVFPPTDTRRAIVPTVRQWQARNS